MTRDTSAVTPPRPSFMIKVKLPDAGAYHSSPSGDTDYDEAFKRTIFAAKPPGFEVLWPKLGQRWPVDSEGYTFVPLYYTNDKDVLAYYIEQVKVLEHKLARAAAAVHEAHMCLTG